MGHRTSEEHWDRSADDLIIDAAGQVLTGAGVTTDDLDAYWFGTATTAMSGIALSRALEAAGRR